MTVRKADMIFRSVLAKSKPSDPCFEENQRFPKTVPEFCRYTLVSDYDIIFH